MAQPPLPRASTIALRLVELVSPVPFGSTAAQKRLQMAMGRLELDTKSKLIYAFPRMGKSKKLVIPMANVVFWEEAPMCGACGVVPVAKDDATCADCVEIDKQTAPAAPAPVKSDTHKFVKDPATGLIKEVSAEDV